MGRVESLGAIKELWADETLSLAERATRISHEFYSSGLDLAATASHIKATPSELDALLVLGGLDEDILEKISQVNPPKTVWTFLSNATDDEVLQALSAVESIRDGSCASQEKSPSELVYYSMIEVAEPTIEQKATMISGDALRHVVEKGVQFDGALSDWDVKFMKSVSGQKKRGKALSEKQGAKIFEICSRLAERGILSRDSIDGDKEICAEILDAIGR